MRMRPFHMNEITSRAITAPPRLYPAQRYRPRLKFHMASTVHDTSQASSGARSGMRSFPDDMPPIPLRGSGLP